jgi:hypothetical protein
LIKARRSGTWSEDRPWFQSHGSAAATDVAGVSTGQTSIKYKKFWHDQFDATWAEVPAGGQVIVPIRNAPVVCIADAAISFGVRAC